MKNMFSKKALVKHTLEEIICRYAAMYMESDEVPDCDKFYLSQGLREIAREFGINIEFMEGESALYTDCPICPKGLNKFCALQKLQEDWCAYCDDEGIVRRKK